MTRFDHSPPSQPTATVLKMHMTSPPSQAPRGRGLHPNPNPNPNQPTSTSTEILRPFIHNPPLRDPLSLSPNQTPTPTPNPKLQHQQFGLGLAPALACNKTFAFHIRRPIRVVSLSREVQNEFGTLSN